MDPSPNVNSKINDAIVKKLSNCNVSRESTMGNPLKSTMFNDQKRVIKKMIVMDTSKLKGLGIESTIKNAMSKLEKGEHFTFKGKFVLNLLNSNQFSRKA